MERELIVEAASAGERLDRFLAAGLGRTRSAAQKLIRAGLVRVNSGSTTPSATVKSGDRVTVDELKPASAAPVPAPPIVFENDELLVISKPSGLTVHPGAGQQSGTLVDWLRSHVPGIGAVGDDSAQRPGIVHRLDKEVSGLMVIAKTQPAFEHLKRQFKERRVLKEYLALVHGVPTEPSGTIDLNLERSTRTHGQIVTRTAGSVGRTAITHYQVERTVNGDALLRLRLETGRTHQIRVHLKAIGHPIIGDRLYTNKTAKRSSTELARPFLHAARLRFTDRAGTVRDFTAPLPAELQQWLNA